MATPEAVARGAAAKDKGNSEFKLGNFATAIGHYTAAMLANPNDPTCPLNRAAAYLKLGKNEDAERDCSTVLKLDAKNVKAFFRRGQARVSLQKLAEAHADLQKALKIEPANSAVKGELNRVEEELKLQKAKTLMRTKAADVTPIPITQRSLASPPAPAARSPTRRRRIPIEIIEPKAVPSVQKTRSTSSDLLTPVTSRSLSAPSPPPPTPPKKKQDTQTQPSDSAIRPQVEQAAPASASSSFRAAKEARSNRTMGGIFRPNGQHTIFSKNNGSPDPNPPSAPHEAQPVPASSTQTPAAMEPGVDTTVSSTSRVIRVRSSSDSPPMTLYTFKKHFEAAKSAEDRWRLMTNISPASLPVLFQSSLDAAILVRLVASLRDALGTSLAAPEDVCAYLHALTRVPRFKTVLLFMDDGERSVVQETCALLGTTDVDAETKRAWGLP